MVNMSAKFEGEAHNGLVSIVFSSSKCDAHVQGRKEPQQLYYIPSAMCCTVIINFHDII